MSALGHSSGKAKLSNMLSKRKMLDCIVWQSYTPFFLDSCNTYKDRVWCVCHWALWGHSKYAGNQSKKIKEVLVLVKNAFTKQLYFFNLANLYSLRTKGLFLYCSVFKIESINVDLDGQLPCRATEKAQLCEGRGVKKHPSTNPLPQKRHSCSDSTWTVQNTKSHPPPALSQSTHFLSSPYSYILASLSTQQSSFS